MSISTRTKVKPPTSVSVTYSVISTGVFVAKLGWTPAQSAWPNSYSVLYRDEVEFATSITGSTYRDTTVLEGESHNYTVTTVNVNEVESPDGSEASVKVPFYPVWQTGWSLSIQQSASDTVAVRCTDPDSNSLSFSGVNPPAGVTVAANGSVNVASSAAAGSYTLAVQASNGSLASIYSASLTVVSIQQTPDPPVSASAAVASTTSVDLSWSRAPTGPAPDDYDIRYATSLGGSTTFVAHAGVATTRTATGLSAGDFYFEIRAGLGANESAWVPFSPYPVTITSTAPADFIIPANATVFDGSNAAPVGGGANRAVQPGETVEFEARSSGTGGSSQALIIRNVRGGTSNRITIRAPSSGQVIIRRASAGSGNHVFRLENVQDVNFSLLSTSAPQTTDGKRHGVKVMYAASGTDNPSQWFKLQVLVNPSYDPNGAGYGGCKNITIDGLEVDGGWPTHSNNGIGVSSNDHSAKASDYPGLWQENIVLSNLYIHDIKSEGMYLGPNPYLSVVSNATEGTGQDIPLRNIEIKDSWLVNIGGEGLNPKSWFGGVNSIHDNVIINTSQASANGSGAINCNSCKVSIYKNYIENAVGPSINCNIGPGTHINFPDPDTAIIYRVYDNIIRKTGSPTSGDGIQAQHSNKTGVPTTPASWYARMRVFCNTVTNHNGSAVDISNGHTSSYARCNLLTAGSINYGSNASSATNITSGTLADTFIAPNGTYLAGTVDMHLLAAKTVNGTVGSGADSTWGTAVDIPPTDYDGVTRAANTDAGAYEF